ASASLARLEDELNALAAECSGDIGIGGHRQRACLLYGRFGEAVEGGVAAGAHGAHVQHVAVQRQPDLHRGFAAGVGTGRQGPVAPHMRSHGVGPAGHGLADLVIQLFGRDLRPAGFFFRLATLCFSALPGFLLGFPLRLLCLALFFFPALALGFFASLAFPLQPRLFLGLALGLLGRALFLQLLQPLGLARMFFLEPGQPGLFGFLLPLRFFALAGDFLQPLLLARPRFAGLALLLGQLALASLLGGAGGSLLGLLALDLGLYGSGVDGEGL